MGAFPETEAQRLYRENQDFEWKQNEAARIKRDYIKAFGAAKWNEYQQKLVKDAEGLATFNAKRDDDKRIQDTKEILLNKVLGQIYVGSRLDPIDSGTYTYEVQKAKDLREGNDPASLRQLAADVLKRAIKEQEDLVSGARRQRLTYFGAEQELKEEARTKEMGKRLNGSPNNVVALYNLYSGWIAKLKQLETQYESVLNADAVARAALASEDPSYKINYSDGTIIKNDVSAASAAVSAAIGGGLPGMANGGLGTLNAAQLADLRNVLAKEQGEKNKVADGLKEKSEREAKAASNLAKAVQAQQDKERGPKGGTPVAPLVRKPPPVKTPVKPAKPPKFTGKKK